jgi:hypothetical protein
MHKIFAASRFVMAGFNHSVRQRPANVRPGEIIALEQQPMFRRGGKGVRKAVANIQRGWVSPLPEPPKGIDRKLGLYRRDSNHFGADHGKKTLKALPPGIAFLAFNDKGQLHPGNRGDQADRRGLNRFAKAPLVRLIEKYGNNRRRVDHHQRHMPFSS